MPIFFNVKSVREFLLDKGYVYTLRKKRKRVGNDVAVVGSYYKRKTIAKVWIERVGITQIFHWIELAPYFDESGLKSSASEWFELAQKMSGKELYLYRVTIREK